MLRKITTRNIARRVGNLPVFHYKTSYHRGGVLLNRLGLQVFRLGAKHIVWMLRRWSVTEDVRCYVDELMRGGVVVIPNFLTAEQFEAVKSEFDRSRDKEKVSRYNRRLVNGLVSETFNFSKAPGEFPCIKRYVHENPVIYELASAVLKRRIKYPAAVIGEIYRNEDPGEPNVDVENVLHADVHYPTVKAWLYMSHVDERNGAYTYAYGSHKLNWPRIMHEYDMSVRQALMRKGRLDDVEEELIDRGRNRIADEHFRNMNVVEKQLCGGPNTLVVSNNFGFHRRGTLTTTREREALTMSFRYVETLYHAVYPGFGLLERAYGM